MRTTNHDSKLDREFNQIWWWGWIWLAGGSALLGFAWGRDGALQWLLQAGLLWCLAGYQTRRRIDLNRPHSEAPLYGELGWGNRLTLVRAGLIAAVGGFLFQRWPNSPVLAWLPGMLYLCAAVIDRVDGYVARRTRHGSLLGTELDTVFDALGLAVASLLAYGYGQVHWSYLLVGAAYYLFHGGLAWRKHRGLPVYALPPALHRRAWAGFQMGFLVAALWPLFHPPVTVVAGAAFMLPALLGFVVDWLIVSGRIDRQADKVDRFFCRLTHCAQTVIQPGLRLAIVAMLSLSLRQWGFTPLSAAATAWQSVIVSGGCVLAAALITLGIAGRTASLMLIGLLGWHYIDHPPRPVDYVLFSSVVWLLLLGTGRFSLWQADERWLNRYDGA